MSAQTVLPISPGRADIAALLLRGALGTMWWSHAALKWFVFSIPGFAAWLDSQGLPASMAWPVFLMEVIGGGMILLGVCGRWASAALIPVLAVTVWVHADKGWVFTGAGGGWEYPVFLSLATLAHLALGDGRYALLGGTRARAG